MDCLRAQQLVSAALDERRRSTRPNCARPRSTAATCPECADVRAHAARRATMPGTRLLRRTCRPGHGAGARRSGAHEQVAARQTPLPRGPAASVARTARRVPRPDGHAARAASPHVARAVRARTRPAQSARPRRLVERRSGALRRGGHRRAGRCARHPRPQPVSGDDGRERRRIGAAQERAPTSRRRAAMRAPKRARRPRAPTRASSPSARRCTGSRPCASDVDEDTSNRRKSSNALSIADGAPRTLDVLGHRRRHPRVRSRRGQAAARLRPGDADLRRPSLRAPERTDRTIRRVAHSALRSCAQPTSTDGSPTFEESDTGRVRRPLSSGSRASTPTSGIALSPNPPAGDPLAGQPEWSWWAPLEHREWPARLEDEHRVAEAEEAVAALDRLGVGVA